jgi:hypothetical protein
LFEPGIGVGLQNAGVARAMAARSNAEAKWLRDGPGTSRFRVSCTKTLRPKPVDFERRTEQGTLTGISGMADEAFAFLGGYAARDGSEAFQRASTLRSAIFRSKAFSLAKTCSIGLRSGLWTGRNNRVAPAD